MNSYTMTRATLSAFTYAARSAGCPAPDRGKIHEPSFKAWLAGRDLRAVRPRQGLAQRQNQAASGVWCGAMPQAPMSGHTGSTAGGL